MSSSGAIPGITAEQQAFIISVAEKLLPTGFKLYAFGSRVGGKIKEHSDLDLLVDGPTRLPITALGLLREAYQESTLPFQVDILDAQRSDTGFIDLLRQSDQLVWLCDGSLAYLP